MLCIQQHLSQWFQIGVAPIKWSTLHGYRHLNLQAISLLLAVEQSALSMMQKNGYQMNTDLGRQLWPQTQIYLSWVFLNFVT